MILLIFTELVRNGIRHRAAVCVLDILRHGFGFLHVSSLQRHTRSGGLCGAFVGRRGRSTRRHRRSAQSKSASVGTKTVVVRCHTVLPADGQRRFLSFVL